MLCDRIRIRNFGPIADAMLETPRFCVLVGPNDSGKTVFLRALRAFGAFTIGGSLPNYLDMPLVRRASASTEEAVTLELWRESVQPAFHLDVSITHERARYPAAMSGHMAGTSVVWSQEERFRFVTGGSNLLDALPSSDAPPGFATAHEAVCRDLARVEYYRLDPGALRRPSFAATEATVPRLGWDGSGLPTLLSVLGSYDNERVGRIRETFSRAVTSLAGFRVYPTAIEGSAAHRLSFVVRGSSREIDAAQVSDGALLFLAFITMANHPEPPSALLVEEPENGVHPGRLRDVVLLLRRLTEETEAQIFLTTHSPYLLDEVAPEEAFFFRREPSGDTSIRRFDKIPDIEERLADYALGELWTAYGEERLDELVRQ